MADRYWVGGTANWNGTIGTLAAPKWAATSGGPGDQSVPISTDAVFFDSKAAPTWAALTAFTAATTAIVSPTIGNNFYYECTTSGTTGAVEPTWPTTVGNTVTDGTVVWTCRSPTITIAAGNTGAQSITCTGFTGAIAGTAAITVAGSVTLVAGMTYTYSGTLTISGTGTLTSAGKTFNGGVTVAGVGISVSLGDALTCASTITHNSGTINVNNFNLTCLTFTSANATRTMAFGATGTITVTSTATATIWNTAFGSNLTVTGTPNVIFTSTGANNPTIQMGGTAEANSLSFTFNGGSYTPVLSSGATYRNLTFLNAFTGTLSNVAMSLFGDLTIGSGMTLAAGANAVSFISTSATTRNITTNGKTFNFPVTFNGSGGRWLLVDDFTMGSARTLTHTNGMIDLNGKTLTVGTAYTTAAGTKNLTFNGGTLVCPNASATAFNNAAPTNFTTTAGTGTGKISMTAATAKTFVGGARTYNCTLSNDGAGALTISGSNTFTTLANGVQPTTFTFTSGTTTTLTNWNISGTSGNLVTIGSTAASAHTLSKASGTVSADYLTISFSTATGGATWNAGANSTDGGNNTGWVFAVVGIIAAMAASEVGPDILAANAFIGYAVTAAMAASEVGPDIFVSSAYIGTPPPPVVVDVYLIKLRSFTEHRRF
jgi:hypothetical protein